MADERLVTSLQLSVLAALCFDGPFGTVISAQVKPTHFDDLWRDFAGRVLQYRKRFGKPPGDNYVEDLAAQAVMGKDTALFKKRLLPALFAEAEGLNAEYVANRVQDFVRRQVLKRAVIEAGDRYQQDDETMVGDVERILHDALKFRAQTLDAGTFLDDPNALRFVDHDEERISLGIPELDRMRVGLIPKQILLYIAAKGCLVGDTLVDCPRDLAKYPQGIPIKDLVGKTFFTYSWDFKQDRPCVSKVLDVWCSGKKPVYRVRLSAWRRQKTGKKGGGTRRAQFLPPLELVGTFDHLVLLADGSWKKLGECQPGDSLKSLYRRAESSKGGSCLTWTSDKVVSVREHQFICTAAHGVRPGTGKEFHTHHKNENPHDNTPDNLEWKSRTAHLADHLRNRNLAGTAGWLVTGVHPKGMRGKRHTVKTKARQREAAVQIAKGRKRNSFGWFVRAPNHTVLSVEYVGVRDVFDMEVEGHSNFVANGVFVHNSGKSWFCVHCGKQALLQRKKVVHVSLEMDETQVIPRYYQSLFGAAETPDRYNKTVLEFDELGRLSGFKTTRVKPRLDFTQPGVRKLLRTKMASFGTRLSNLVVKYFPTASLTIEQLVGYLDYLAEFEGFVPHVLLVDYPKLMKQDKSDLRISLGHTVEELRGLAGLRNVAVVAPHQGTRSSMTAKRVRSDMAGEDISVVQTADIVLAFSRTEAEERLGLGRLSVEHVRRSKGGGVILLSQAYDIGQYVLNSAPMQAAYWDKMKLLGDDDE